MSPKIQPEQYVTIDADRIRELSKERHITQTYIAKTVLGYEYRHYTRELAKGCIKKEWLEKICDCLGCSRKYLTGESPQPGNRVNDFYLPDMMKQALKQLLIFSEMGHYTAQVEEMRGQDIENLVDILTAMLDSPEEFYKIVPMEQIEKIHSKKIFGEE